MGKLLERAKEADKVWKPTEVNEALEGRLIKIRQVQFGRVLVVRGFAYGPDGTPTHERGVDWLVNVGKDSTLSSKIDDARAREGMEIAILFKGIGTSKNGREFKSWSIAVDDPDPPSDGGMNGQDQVVADAIPF